MSDLTFDLPTGELLKRRIHYLLQTEYDGNVSKLYRHMYPEDEELHNLYKFEHYIKRDIYNQDFIRRLAQKTKAGEATLRQLFDVQVNNEDLW